MPEDYSHSEATRQVWFIGRTQSFITQPHEHTVRGKAAGIIIAWVLEIAHGLYGIWRDLPDSRSQTF